MSNSYTDSTTESFNVAHARKIASKVATDLQKFHRFYNGQPSLAQIADYEAEMVVLLKYKAISSVIYGFKRNGKWTEAAVRYTAMADGTLSSDDDPGKIRPGLDVAGASFTSFLHWDTGHLSQEENAAMENEVPFSRNTTETPQLESGQWVSDLNYFAGGRGLGRATVRK